VIRKLIAVVAFAASPLIATTAEACISCEYKPEVLGSSSTSAKSQKRERVRAVIKHRSREDSGRVAKRRHAPQTDVDHARAKSEDQPSTAVAAPTEPSEPAAAKRDAAAAPATKTEPVSEPSTVPASAAVPADASGNVESGYRALVKTQPSASPPSDSAPSATVTAAKPAPAASPPPGPEPKAAKPPTETAQSAPSDAAAPAPSEAAAPSVSRGADPVVCKKFFPMADLTLTVPCK
jgi:hypothetical protein